VSLATPCSVKHLGDRTEGGYQGLNSPLYHAVLAEVISEALAFYVLNKRFSREGDQGKLDYTSTDLYYHRDFSDFLAIAHRCLVTEVTYNS